MDPLFPGPLFPTHGTVKADFVHAGLEGEDDQGRIVDFHALRHYADPRIMPIQGWVHAVKPIERNRFAVEAEPAPPT